MGHVVASDWNIVVSMQIPEAKVSSSSLVVRNNTGTQSHHTWYSEPGDLTKFILSKTLEYNEGVRKPLQSVINSCTSDGKNFHFQRICWV